MTYNSNPLYTQTNSLTYGVSSTQLDPVILRGSRSLYRPSLPYFVEFIFAGLTPEELRRNKYVTSIAESAAQWNHNFVTSLQGNDIMVDGSPGMINVLPKGQVDFIVYEDEIPNVTKFTSTSISDNAAQNVNVCFSATDIKQFQVNDLLINYSKSVDNVVRVTAVSYTAANPFVTVTAFGGSAILSTTVFCTATTDGACTDRIEIIGTAEDLITSTLPSARRMQDFSPITAISTYTIQEFQDSFEVPAAYDGKQRAYGDMEHPMAVKLRLECFHRHLQKISRNLIWGKGQALTGTGNNRTAFKGLYNSIQTNVVTLADGFLSLSDIDDIFVNKLGGTYSSQNLYGFCSMPTLLIIETLFNTLGNNSVGMFEKYMSGFYSMEIAIVRYRGKTLHLIPVADFMDSDRTFLDQSTAAGANLAGNLFIVDPEAIFTVVGQHQERGAILFDLEENVQLPEETYTFRRHVLRSKIGFALRHEKTSALIKNIRRADIVG